MMAITPPRTPRAIIGTCLSPPKPSHHDSDEEITSEDVIKFQQDGLAQKLMLRALEENGDQYFYYMAARGWKLPQGFDVEWIIHKWEPTKAEILREEVQELRKQFAQLQTSKEQPKNSFIDSICALPFDRSLYM